jgi:hypothetical protein
MSWQSYPLTHMAGFSTTAEPRAYQLASGAPRGHILHDFLEARVLPKIVGPVGPGNLHYAAMWKVAQRLTKRPVKFGTILPELLAASVADEYYKDPVERVWAISDALNSELGELADAGCPVSSWRSRRSIWCRSAASPSESSMSTSSSIPSTTRSRVCAARPKSGAIPAGATPRSSESSGMSRAIADIRSTIIAFYSIDKYSGL